MKSIVIYQFLRWKIILQSMRRKQSKGKMNKHFALFQLQTIS